MSVGEKIVAAMRDLSQVKDASGRPTKGKLKCLVVNTGLHDCQAIAESWFVERWNVSKGTDPLACIGEVLTTPPDMRPLSPSTPDFVRPVDPEPANVTVAEPLALPGDADLGDLLV